MSPIVLVKKKNGEQRMCFDYRALNAKTVKNRFPVAPVDEFLETLKGGRYLTSLDLASRYHQLQIKASFMQIDVRGERLRKVNRWPLVTRAKARSF